MLSVLLCLVTLPVEDVSFADLAEQMSGVNSSIKASSWKNTVNHAASTEPF